MILESDPRIGHASSMSSATPAAFLSAMSMTTTSASCLSATPRATVAPTLPAPPTTVTLRFIRISSKVDQPSSRRHEEKNEGHEAFLFFKREFVPFVLLLRVLREEGSSHYIFEMIASPKSDVESSVAPSISRAKS